MVGSPSLLRTRWFVRSGLAVVAVVLLAACGGTGAAPSNSLGQRVTYKNISFEVPQDWRVQKTTPNDPGCNSGTKVVVLGAAVSSGFCLPVDPGSVMNIRVQDVPQLPADESAHVVTTSTVVNKIPAQRGADTPTQLSIQLPRDNVEIDFYGSFGAQRDAIVKSIREVK
jgi:hypothetical protein